jgi:hypothetical protein
MEYYEIAGLDGMERDSVLDGGQCAILKSLTFIYPLDTLNYNTLNYSSLPLPYTSSYVVSARGIYKCYA